MVRTGWKITGDANENGQWYHGVDLLYNSAGLVWINRSSKWQLNSSNAVINEVGLAAMEYRYDSARGRYRTQRRDPRTKLANGSSNTAHFLFPYDPSLADGPCWNVPAEGTWSDYDGGGIHGDYTLAITGTPPNQTVTKNDTAGHEPSLGHFSWAGTPAEPNDPNYAYGNLIGTTEAMTYSTSSISRRAVFTAFGEPVYENGSTDTRYGYAGAWGYQESGTGDPLVELGWLHVGARYYDPAAGRFMQRDPIGIRGGFNTYSYAYWQPSIVVDPLGLFGEWYDGAPVGANLVLFLTPKFLDDASQRNAVQIGLAGGSGAITRVIVKRVPLASNCADYLVWAYGAYRMNNSLGPDLDRSFDAFALGYGAASLPRVFGGSNGTLKGLPGSTNGPYIVP